MFKNNMFLDTMFAWFVVVLTSENAPNSNFVWTFFENVNFVQIELSPRRRAHFQGSEPPKNDQKSMPKRTRK